MRIGIDTRELMGRPTGVGRYLAELLGAWADPSTGISPAHDFVLYGPSPLPRDLQRRFEPLRPATRVVAGSGGTWWEQTSLTAAAARDRLNLFFAPAYTSPLRLSCPVALTIHDLSFFAHPEWFGAREGLRRRLFTRLSARRASVVLTDTEFSRSEIHVHLGIARERVRVVRLGAGLPPSCRAMRTTGSDWEPVPPERERLILYVGSVFNRRRVPDLINAMPAVLAEIPDARLEIVGENRTFPRQDLDAMASATGCAGRIRLRSYVPDADLADAFRRASVFVFLSEYEGFGLTPIEALACGVPVVVLDTPVAREVCGEAAQYVAPGDASGLVSAIVEFLRDPGARRARLAAASEVLAQYSWPDTARRTMAALEEAGR